MPPGNVGNVSGTTERSGKGFQLGRDLRGSCHDHLRETLRSGLDVRRHQAAFSRSPPKLDPRRGRQASRRRTSPATQTRLASRASVHSSSRNSAPSALKSTLAPGKINPPKLSIFISLAHHDFLTCHMAWWKCKFDAHFCGGATVWERLEEVAATTPHSR